MRGTSTMSDINVNPACAGMIRAGRGISVRFPGKPRVCGDDPDDKRERMVVEE